MDIVSVHKQRKLRGSAQLSTIHGSDGRHFELRVTDSSSRVRFVSVELTMEQMGDLISGGEVECGFAVCGLSKVGKHIERIHATVTVSESKLRKLGYGYASSKDLEKYLLEYHSDDYGPDAYISPTLRSQGSVQHRDGKVTMSFHYVKFNKTKHKG